MQRLQGTIHGLCMRDNKNITRIEGYLKAFLLLGSLSLLVSAHANPTGGVVTLGSASISSSGSHLVINQTSSSAFINWQNFNIGAGETTIFNQPSSSSVTWNYINNANAPSASTINGMLNANGYVILQNPNGFTVGGSAVINAHGLVMTTAPTPGLDLSGGGPWSFDAPPPTAKVINYGRINMVDGGSVYLIASDIENNGTISAPDGKIGLYAGQKVLVSMSPDGRGLSAEVTLSKGSVDNEGNLIADAGSIVAQAEFLNQNGFVQANSVKNVNGTIQLVASDSMTLGANSTISAKGDSSGVSSGGAVTIESSGAFSDQAGSSVVISGGAQGGNGGQVDISAPQVNSLNTLINGQAASGYIDGIFTLDPQNIQLVGSGGNGTSSEYSSGTVNSSDTSSLLTLNVNSFSSTLSQINLQANNNIEVSTLWNLSSQGSLANLTLTAGNNITVDNGAGINGAANSTGNNNWAVNLSAGGSILLNGSGYLQTYNQDLTLNAVNSVTVGSGAIRTIGGGNIFVTTVNGSVNSGSNPNGYNYLATGNGTASLPYYTPFQLAGIALHQTVNFSASNIGGIATAAGGNVAINSGADVISYPATTVAAGDPGIGAFGPEAGNVSITAKGSVYGNFIEANGNGSITANQNIGNGPSPGNPSALEDDVALSLVNGSWTLNAGGSIYLQEVRNPNGVFNNTRTPGRSTPSAGNHLFDYSPQASVTLDAGNAVYLTGVGLPRPDGAVPMLLPPTLNINAGSGGVVLETPNAVDGNGNSLSLFSYDITLFPSPDGNLSINTTGGGWLTSGNSDGSQATLLMSDSSYQQWFIANSGAQPFSETDHSSVPAEAGNTTPVTINLAGSQNANGTPVAASMDNVILQTDKATKISVAGNMLGVTFFGENLNASDVTSISVGGEIYNAGSFNSVTLAQDFPTLGFGTLPPGALNDFSTVLNLAVNPSLLPTFSLSSVAPSLLASYLVNAAEFPGLSVGESLAYDPTTKTLTAVGPISSQLYTALSSPTLTLVEYGPNGYPQLDSSGHFITVTIPWVPANSANAAEIAYLNAASQSATPLGANDGAYVVGGMGAFDVSANSISLGNSAGILSVGSGHIIGRDYSFLTPYMTSPGASIDVTVAQDQTTTVNGVTTTTSSLSMPSSTIASFAGGDVTVTSTGGSMDLGSQSLLPFQSSIMANNGQIGLGIYTSGGGNVAVTSLGTINIDSSRIASLDGGNVYVTSTAGDVNAGSGGTIAIPVNSFSSTFAFPYEPVEYVYANGIVADTLAPVNGAPVPVAATVPGNIYVSTPDGNIYANVGGILQESLSGPLLPGPTIYLVAGTPGNSSSSVGNIELGNSGVIGGTVNVNATGKVSGLLISSQNANITSQSVQSLTVLSGGAANVNSQGSGGGITIVGAQGVTASGVGSGATVLGQNVSVNGGATTSTLGNTATATATSSSAAQQTTSQAQQQVAGNLGSDFDDTKKKKKPALRRVSRVTVILSAAVPR